MSASSELKLSSKEDPTKLFEITQLLGEGSYGSVMKALDKRDGQFVAVKILDIATDVSDLKKEIQILIDCKSPYIVAYKGTFAATKQTWIVMEYCDAGSVCDLMSICTLTLSEAQVANVLKQSLLGLEYLHSQKKIHRDIKSGNILLNLEGEAKLADFGVSAQLTATMDRRKTMIGTPYWMAPEVLQSQSYDEKADIWSLGITAMEMALGDPPHSEVHPMRAIFLIPNQPAPTLPDDEPWSTDFRSFLALCLDKDPTKRPSCTTLLQHPFIANAPGNEIIAELVEENIDDIEEYRDTEEDSEDDEEESDTGATMVANSTMVGPGDTGGDSYNTMDYSTMVADGMDTVDYSNSNATLNFGQNAVKPRRDSTLPAYMKQFQSADAKAVESTLAKEDFFKNDRPLASNTNSTLKEVNEEDRKSVV